MDPPPAYSIAPHCVGTAGGGRCTLKEFLEHIWLPDRPSNGKEPVTEADRPKLPKDFAAKNGKSGFEYLFKTIMSWKTPPPPKDPTEPKPKKGDPKPPRVRYPQTTLTGALDNDRLLSGSVDFFDALGKFGGALSKARGMVDDPALKGDTDKDKSKTDLDKLGKDGDTAANLVVTLR